nr:MAG TPA: hypothetical protein [Ackermannviridae sp.]
MGTSLTKPMKTGYNAVCQGRRTTMVVNGKKYFFEYLPFEKRGGGTRWGGVFFEKSLARSLFRYAPPRPRNPALPLQGGLPPIE